MLELLTCKTQIDYFSLVLRLIRCLQILLLCCCRGLRRVTVSDDNHARVTYLHRSAVVHRRMPCADWVTEWWLSLLRWHSIRLRWRLATMLALAWSSSCCLRAQIIVRLAACGGTHRVAMQNGLVDRLAWVLLARVRGRWMIVRRLYLHCDNSVWDFGEVLKYIECKLF